MTDSWDDRRKAKEEEYFAKANSQAIERLKSRASSEPRKSPITGEAMEQLTVMGVVVDRCPTSGGIWLDKGELEELLSKARADATGKSEGGVLSNFIGELFGTSK